MRDTGRPYLLCDTSSIALFLYERDFLTADVLMAPEGDSTYFPPLDKCLGGKSQLL